MRVFPLLLCASCSSGTFVVLELSGQGTPPAPIHAVDLSLTLDGRKASARILAKEISLPTDASLQIDHGAGAFSVEAIARGDGDAELGRGTASGTVKSDSTLRLPLQFAFAAITVTDMGADSGTSGTLVMDNQPSYDFGTVLVGTFSADVILTVTNNGPADSGILQAASFSGNNPGDFSVASDDCGGKTLAAGETCTLTVQMTAAAIGTRNATVSVSATPGGSASTKLTGEAVMPGTLVIEPASFDFMGVALGAIAESPFTVRNGGTMASGNLSLSLKGSNAAQYQIVSGSDTCSGAPLAPAATCTVTLRFKPTQRGTRPATLQVDATPGGPGLSMLSGRGLADALLATSPMTSLDFTFVDVGAPAAHEVLVTNSGDVPSSPLSAPLLTGDPSFTIDAENCSGLVLMPLAANSCKIAILHTPPAWGIRTATLTVAASPTGGTQMVALSATGRQTVTLTVATTGTGTVTSTPAGDIDCGGGCTFSPVLTNQAPTISLHGIAGSCYGFQTWSGDTTCTTAADCDVLVDSDKSLMATFAQTQYHVNLTRQLVESALGTVTVNGTACAPTCDLDVACGSTVNLTAVAGGAGTTPLNRFGFAGWAGTPGTCSGTTAPCSFSPTADVTATATFSPFNYAFYTSTTNFTTNLGGTAGADSACQALAASLPGGSDYVAFLSTDTVAAPSRLVGPLGIIPRGWLRYDGAVFVDTVADLSLRHVRVVPLMTEGGVTATTFLQVLTGTSQFGSAATGETCNGWTSSTSSNFVVIGDALGGSVSWLSYYSAACKDATMNRIYCMGTRYQVPVAVPPVVGNRRRIFVSASGFAPGPGKDINSADGLCKSDAVAGGVCATIANCPFKAVLARTGVSAKSHFTNQDGATQIVRLDNVIVASSATNFWANTLLAPPDESTRGDKPNFVVFTGATSPTSTLGDATSTCTDWSSNTSAIGTGQRGHPSNIQEVFNVTTGFDCGSTDQIYCLEDIP